MTETNRKVGRAPGLQTTHRSTLQRLAAQTREGRLDRREFTALASILGLSASASGAMIGLAPQRAVSQEPQRGGELRVAMRVMNIADPRKFDWPEMANVARQFCETLVRWEPDFSFTPQLLEGWEVAEDASRYVLSIRQGVSWTNGDAFTAEDVAHNIRRMCDATVEGNSMATALSSLIDADTKQLADGALEIVDDFTVVLTPTRPDISLIPALSDYPALIVHRSHGDDSDLAQSPIGTGPFELESLEVGGFARVLRRTSGAWWGGEALLDAIEFNDFGTDPAPMIAALESGDVHVNDETPADLVPQLDAVGLERQEKETAQTIVCRMNVKAEPYTDVRVRRAIQMLTDNTITLQVGLEGRGLVAENHHVGPMHPEYAEMAAPEIDVEKGLAMLEEAGARETEFDLISIDGDFQRTTMDAVAGQLRQAGLTIKRTVIPGATFWNNWTGYPFSATDWGGRPLGVQVLALAYRSKEPWNETGFADPEFDAALDEALGMFDPDARRVPTEICQTRLREAGVIIQPYWRKMYLHHAPELHGYERHQAREMVFEKAWLES